LDSFFRDIASYFSVALSVRKGEDLFKESQILENYISSSSDSIVIHDMAGNFLYVNPATYSLFGYVEDEVYSTKITDYIAKEDMDSAKRHRERRLEGYQGHHESRVSLIKRDGTKIPVEIISTMVQLQTGPVFILQIKDLIEETAYRKRLELLNSFTSILVEAASIQEIADYTVQLLHEHLGFNALAFNLVSDNSYIVLSHSGFLTDAELVMPLDGKGIINRSISELKSQLVLDTSTDQDHQRKGPDIFNALSELDVPVIVNDSVVAVISVQAPTKNAFNQYDQYLIEIFSKHVVSALQRLQQSRLFKGIRVYGRLLSEAIDYDDIADVSINYMIDFMGAHFASFHLVEGEYLRTVKAVPFIPNQKVSLKRKGIITKAYHTSSPVLVNDTRMSSDFFEQGANSLSELAVPVLSSSHVLAILNVESEQTYGFNQSDQLFLETFADEVALAINRIKSYDLLQRSEEYYHSLIENMNEGICVTDADSVITFVNKKLPEYFNCISEEMIGRSIYDFFSDNEVEKIKILKSRRVQGYSNTYETFLKRSDDSVFPVIIQASPIFDYNGKFNGVIAGVIDISNIYAAQQKLIESEERFRNLLIELPDPVFITDSEKYLFVNRAGANILEVDDSSVLIGCNFIDFFNPEDRAKIKENAKKRLDGEPIPTRYDTILYSKTGQKIPVDARFRLINFEGENAILTILRDMRERVRYEKRLKALYDHSYQLDKAESIEEVFLVSQQAMQNSLSGEVFDIIKVEDDRLVDIFTNLKEPFSIQISDPGITTRAARTKQTQLVNNVITDPEYVTGVDRMGLKSEIVVPVLVHDEVFCLINVESREQDAFTPQDQEILETFSITIGNAVEKLIRFDTLETLVSERTKELERTNKQLQELDQVKDRFVSQAAHELRTPLTSIKGYLEIMEPRLKECPSEFANYYEIIVRNTMRLSALTDDLLNQQRITSERFYINKEKINIYELIEAAISDVSLILLQKDIRIKREFEENLPIVHADSIRITQVIVNLLENAAKFNPDGSPITITLKKIDGFIEVAVKDEGLGLSEEDIPKLFKPFPDIEKLNYYIGTGLGLSICKGIVELHNGEIKAVSEGINKGSCFCFTLPI